MIIQHLLGSGGKMIVDQACHKSIHHAVILYGVEPVYLEASLKAEYGFYGPVPVQRILAAIEANRDAGCWYSPPAPMTASTTTSNPLSSTRMRADSRC